MKNSTEGTRTGVQWTLWSQHEGLDFENYLTLLFQQHQQMQDKTINLASETMKPDLKINDKTKVIKELL